MAPVWGRRPAHHLRVEAARRGRLETRRDVGGDHPATPYEFQEDGRRATADAARKVHAGGEVFHLWRSPAERPGSGRPGWREDHCGPGWVTDRRPGAVVRRDGNGS